MEQSSRVDRPVVTDQPTRNQTRAPQSEVELKSLWLSWTVLAIVLAAHVWQTFRLFPSWRAMVSDEPVISVDHAIHLYHGYLGARFLKEHATSWGYDPFFMAGYPKTPVYDSSSAPAELFQLLAGGYSPRAYKIGVAVLVLLVPAVIGLAGWACGARLPVLAAAVAWTWWYWWAGFPSGLVRSGLVAFVWASALAVALPALLVRWGKGPRWSTWLAVSFSAAAGFHAHAIFPLMAIVPVAIGYAWLFVPRQLETGSVAGNCGARQRPGWLWHLATWGALLVALAATNFWWRPLLKFLPLKTASTIFMKAEYWGFIWDFYLDLRPRHDGFIPLLLVLFGLIGLAAWWRAGRRLEVVVVTSQIVVLSLLTLAGSMWRVTLNLEPLRFQVPLGLTWCVPAGQGACTVLAALSPVAWRGPRIARLRWLGAAAVAVFVLLVTTPSLWWRAAGRPVDRLPPSTWRLSLVRLRFARPLAVGLRPEMQDLATWIRENTDSSARILFEDQLRLWEATEPESLHWTPLLPLLTGREFIGGLYQLAFIPHQRAAFGDWHLAGRHIRAWSPEELRVFCEQYNIGWIITWSRISLLKPGEDRGRPLSTDVFANTPFCELVKTLPRHTFRPDEDRYSVFRVQREHSYFARGHGRVKQVDYNRIELADLEPEAGELVLRYHWQDGLRSDPPLALERSVEPGDPDAPGFIRILTAKPIERVVLHNRYR